MQVRTGPQAAELASMFDGEASPQIAVEAASGNFRCVTTSTSLLDPKFPCLVEQGISPQVHEVTAQYRVENAKSDSFWQKIPVFAGEQGIDGRDGFAQDCDLSQNFF